MDEEKPAKEAAEHLPKKNKKPWLIIVVTVVLLLAGVGAYWWRDNQAKTAEKQKQAEISALKQKVSELEAQLAESETSDDASAEEAAEVPSDEMVENIKAVFATGNTQPLETYMIGQVNVILTASECCGKMSPEDATAQITSWMEGTTDPWNFNLPQATLDSYASGDYAEYFPDNALVGKSDNSVVSFSFNDAGKINTVFWTHNDAAL